MLNRNNAPAFNAITEVNFLEPQLITLDNGVKVWVLEAGTQDVTKVEFFFPAGVAHSDKKLVASFTHQLLASGTPQYNQAQISEQFDFWGSYFGTSANHHQSIITAYSLGRFMPDTLALLQQIIFQPTFLEDELNILVQKRKQEFILEQEKVKSIASRQFSKMLYGENHPYGNKMEIAYYDALTRDDLVNFHQKNYINSPFYIIISGLPGKKTLDDINQLFGQHTIEAHKSDIVLPAIQTSAEKRKHIEKPGAVQTAIKMGIPLFNRTHPDFMPLQIVNTILGGYFGSRLMTNIREEKGYTYGIASHILSLREAGMWVINTEVKSEATEDTISEITKEIERLKTEPIEPDELELVKNYMLGEILRQADGAFAQSDIFSHLVEFDLNFDYYKEHIKQLNSVTADEIMRLANQYLHPQEMICVTVG